MKLLLKLFLTFFKIGCFTVGGGFAMMTVISKEVVEKNHWISEEEMADILVMGQSCPGVVAINTATAVGITTCGFLGGLFATLGMIFPSFFIIVLIGASYERLKANAIIESAFNGIRACVIALMIVALIKIHKSAVKNKQYYILSIISFLLIILFNVSIPYLILGAFVFSVAQSCLFKKSQIKG